MARLAVRILLLLAVLAVGRAVVWGLLRSDERSNVIVVLVPGGECVSDASSAEFSEGN